MERNIFEMVIPRRGFLMRRQLLQLVLLHAAWETGSGHLHYSVPEESQHGTFVGRITQDLGLDVNELMPRMFRMESQGLGNYFEVNLQNGILFVNSQIDREELCVKNADCAIQLEMIMDKPLRIFHVEVEIKDINDNPPIFSAGKQTLNVAESMLPGAHFPLQAASDADIGSNAQLKYKLNSTDFFVVEEKINDQHSTSLVLVLKKPLDREKIAVHHLLLTATDGGQPELTGMVYLEITVIDANDNAPVFNQSVYKVKLFESVADGTLVIHPNATDLDEGINQEISYSFSNNAPSNIFTIDSDTGEIKVKGNVDFEENNVYSIEIEAKDKGSPPLSGHCTILIEILDVNDNVPEILLKSMVVPLPEDSPPGTVVALISVLDRDSGANGKVSCSLWPPGLPFKLVSTFKNYHSLVLAEPLDREQVAEFELLVIAQDQGDPSLSAQSSLVLPISDINDNAPTFAQSSYTVFVKENNPPGAHIFTLSASDPDVAENAHISYWLDEKLWPLSSYISVHSENGKLYALQPLDYEELKMLEFQVRAKDAGLPSLCSNVTVQVFVVDENDNAPSPGSKEATIPLMVPIMMGQIVGKIHALDADSGYNAWLCYELHELSSGPWQVGRYNGEISTTRVLDEADGSSTYELLVVVKDHGKLPQSATATLSFSLMHTSQMIHVDAHLPGMGGNPGALVDNANVYLIIAICAVSSLFLLVIIIYVALRCQSQVKETMVYGPGTATLMCASEVGSWSYSNRHSHILAGVSGDAGAKSDLMVFSPNIPILTENGELRNGKNLVPDPSGEPKPPNPDWRYSASLRAGMQGAGHMEEAGGLRAGPGGPEQQWPTVSSATTEPEAGEVSPPVGAGVNSNSWTFKYGPGNPKPPGPGELPDKFIIPGSPAIISIRQDPPNSQTDKSDFITFGKKEETKKKKKKKKGNKAQEKKEKGHSTTDNSDQ
ncbi:protocadherin alpha-5-like isoform X1 [Heteronotia binoei]|uniref:protocadherin alpha-5-like isoform X1 n=1 Tax=Heteronotia binoei TaxID=13085 RepID=UPI00292E370E|nr:protocadherin alpha-5-like isoform X1 [Heteronotia binoei]